MVRFCSLENCFLLEIVLNILPGDFFRIQTDYTCKLWNINLCECIKTYRGMNMIRFFLEFLC